MMKEPVGTGWAAPPVSVTTYMPPLLPEKLPLSAM